MPFSCGCEHVPGVLILQDFLILKSKLQKGLCCCKCDWFCEWSALSQERLNKEGSQYGCSQMVGQWGKEASCWAKGRTGKYRGSLCDEQTFNTPLSCHFWDIKPKTDRNLMAIYSMDTYYAVGFGRFLFSEQICNVYLGSKSYNI